MTQLIAPPTTPLTDRELQCLQLAVYGYDTAAIAAQMYITVATVKTHFKKLPNKLKAKNRVQAGAIAITHGWIKALSDGR